MDNRFLGRTGMLVSELCLGAMTFGRCRLDLSAEQMKRLDDASVMKPGYPAALIIGRR